ncbi:MAG: caspase family protein [Bacteroidota bacterium]
MSIRGVSVFIILKWLMGSASFAQQPQIVLPLGHVTPVSEICFSPDGRLVVTNGGSEEKNVKIWETRTGKLVKTIDAHANRVTSVAFSPDGKYLLTTGHDQHGKVWDIQTGELYYDIFYNSSNWIEKGFITGDGKNVLLLSSDAMEYYDLKGKKLIRRLLDTSSYRIYDDRVKWRHLFHSYDMSRNGEYAVTANSDSSINVWDLKKQSLHLKINGTGFEFLSCDLNTAGDKLLSTSSDNKVRVHETRTGKTIRVLDTKNRELLFAAFSPDDKKIITVTGDSSTRQCRIGYWDAASGKKEQEFNTPPEVLTLSVIASFDGNLLLSMSSDGMIRLWETATGKLLRVVAELDTLYSEGKKMLGKENLHAVTGAFSGDGRYIAASPFTNIPVVQETGNGKTLARLEGVSTLMYNPRYSPDGLFFATAGLKNNLRTDTKLSGVANVWDTRTGKQAFNLAGHTGPINDLQFSKDSKLLVTVSQDSTARIWDLSSGKAIHVFRGHDKGVGDCFLTADNKYLVTKTFTGVARIWNTETGKQTGLVQHDSFSVNKNGIYTITPSKTGKYFKTVFYDDYRTLIIETATGRKVLDFDTQKDSSGFFRFSPDEKGLIYQEKKQIIIRDIETGKVRAVIPYRKRITGLVLNHKGNMLAAASTDSSLRLWDTGNGKLITDLGQVKKGIDYFDFTEDDRYLTGNAYDSSILIWDIATGRPAKPVHIGRDDMYSFNLTRNSRHYVVTRSYESVLKVWDMESGKLLTAVLDKFNSSLNYILHPVKAQFIVDNKFSNDIYNIGSSTYTLRIIPSSSSDYLAIDSAGRFDGTEAARKLLYFTCGTEIIELDQAKDQLWVPDLGERMANGETINAKTLYELNICGLTPELQDAGSRAGEYLFRIKPRRGGLGETVLYVNSIEAQRYTTAQLKKNDDWYELQVKKEALQHFFIAGQENLVTVKAFTADNSISSRGAVVSSREEQKPATAPNLYAVMIGVSDYKGDELDLKYAAKDATDISNAAGSAARKLLNTDGKEHVFMYNLTTAKERYQLPEKNAIRKLMEEIGKKATANDVLLIFFAGHGVMAGEGDKKHFYFLTADASTLASTAAVKEVGISTAELTEWMKPQNIKAQKRILIFDACNSGQAIKDFVKMGGNDQHYLAARNDDKSRLVKAIDKLNEKSGLFILSASASDQNAYEMGRYSQGLLTYSLLKAIKQQPDILEDGKYLNISRWFSAAEKTVSEITRETGARQEPQIVSTTNFNIGLVDEEVTAKIVLLQEKPLFTASNFQNSDEAIADDDMELSKLINLHLSDMAARGADSKIVYVTATNSPDAWSLSGRYSVKENSITVQVNLKQSKVIKNRFEISGTMDKLKELAAAITDKAAGMVK